MSVAREGDVGQGTREGALGLSVLRFANSHFSVRLHRAFDKSQSLASISAPQPVLAGLVPAIHAGGPDARFQICREPDRVDGRDEPGQDGALCPHGF